MLKTLLCFSLFFSFFWCQDGVAAIVGDEIILESAVQEQVSAFLSNTNSLSYPDSVRSEVLNYLIEQEVLAYFANKDTLLKMNELSEYVSTNVREQAALNGREQTPELQGDADRVLVRFQ